MLVNIFEGAGLQRFTAEDAQILGAGNHDLYTQRLSVDLPTMGTPDAGLGTLKAKLAFSGRQFNGFYKNTGPEPLDVLAVGSSMTLNSWASRRAPASCAF